MVEKRLASQSRRVAGPSQFSKCESLSGSPLGGRCGAYHPSPGARIRGVKSAVHPGPQSKQGGLGAVALNVVESQAGRGLRQINPSVDRDVDAKPPCRRGEATHDGVVGYRDEGDPVVQKKLRPWLRWAPLIRKPLAVPPRQSRAPLSVTSRYQRWYTSSEKWPWLP